MASGMLYAVDGRLYCLRPDFHPHRSRMYVTGAEMYDTSGEYIGYWYRKSMPVPLIQQLTAFAKKSEQNRLARENRDRTVRRKRGFR